MLCHNLQGPECESDAECGFSYGSCSSSELCSWKDNPISLRPAIKDERGRLMARVEATLYSNTARTLARGIHDLNIEYTCLPLE